MNAPRRHSTRRPAKSGRALKLTAIWIVIALAAVGFAAAAYHSMTRPPDPFTLCEKDGLPTASTLVIIDTTDALTEIQRRRVRQTVDTERDALPRGGKLSIVTINADNPGEPVEIVSACNPGGAKDVNLLFVTASKTEKLQREQYSGPIDAAIAKAATGGTSTASPIIPTIAAVLPRPDFDARIARRRLVIASDLLEYQRGVYSQLNGGDFWSAYKASPLPRRMPLDLHGVAVAIDYFARPAYAAVQGEAHRNFWRRLFREAGAESIAFIGMHEPDAPLKPANFAADDVADAGSDRLPGPAPTPNKHAANSPKHRKGGHP